METVPEISSALLHRLVRLAATGPEHCGILRGRKGRVVRVDLTANVDPDPAYRFEIDPAALIAAYRQARRPGALDILGWFHTHPTGSPEPSLTDARSAAADGSLWLIAGKGAARLYRAVERGEIHDRFDPVAFDLKVGKRAPERVGVYRMTPFAPMETMVDD